jgi:hypothetical protein
MSLKHLTRFQLKTKKKSEGLFNCKKKSIVIVYTLMIFTFLVSMNANAQNQNIADSLKTDSTTTKKSAATSATPTVQKQKDTRPLSQRIFFDISTSFWISPSSSFFQFFPSVGYRFPKTYSVGAGPIYIYNHDRKTNVNLNGWGGSVYCRAQLLKWFYAYTEYQGIDNEYISDIDLSSDKVTKTKEYADSWFLSVGINIRLGRRHAINMQVLYDVLYQEGTSPHYSEWTYRVGFGF